MLRRIGLLVLSALALVCFSGAPLLAQQQTEPRIAFVIGNAGYGAGALPAALNDAGLVAEALRSIGFEIVEGADLSQTDLVRAYRDFLAKVEASGPDTLAFVYFSGHALSFEGENFLLGVDARLARDSDIPIEGVRMSDLLRPFANSPARAKVMIIDAVRPLPFRPQGKGAGPRTRGNRPAAGCADRLLVRAWHGRARPARRLRRLRHRDRRDAARAGTDLDTAFTHIRSRTHLTTEDSRRRGTFRRWESIDSCRRRRRPQARRRRHRSARRGRCATSVPIEAYALAIEWTRSKATPVSSQAYPGHPYTQRVWADDPRAARGAGLDARSNCNTPQPTGPICAAIRTACGL